VLTLLMLVSLALPVHNEATTIQSQFPHSQQQTAVAVMLAESSGNPDAIGPYGEKGLFQLMSAPSCWRDTLCNVRAAAALWRERGWEPWTTYTSGRYKAFLGQASGLLADGSGSAAGGSSPQRVSSSTVSPMHAGTCQQLQPGKASFGLLGPGSKGALVQRVQSTLKISVDGTYGPKTLASVTSIQHTGGVQVDGVVGRQTACVLKLGERVHAPLRTRVPSVPHRPDSSVVSIAKRYLGIPYVWGGASASGMDCSGFTMLVYREALGLSLPHFSGSQPAYGTKVSNPSPGDLVYWPGHVAIFYGNGYVIGARHSGAPSAIYRLYGAPTFYRMG